MQDFPILGRADPSPNTPTFSDPHAVGARGTEGVMSFVPKVVGFVVSIKRVGGDFS